MGAGLVIPSIFTAVDQMSPTIAKMRSGVVGFGQSAEAAMARTDRVVRRLTPSLSHASKELLHMFGAAAIGAGIFRLGEKSIESLENYETAVDSFKVKVSGLNNLDFSVYQKEIDSIAKTTQKSGAEVAKSFENIAGLNPEFAKTASGLGEVSTAVIVLAEAGKMELGPAAENLVGVMNQFSLSAHDAERTINVLAAAQAHSQSKIAQTSEALNVFGKMAAGANISLEQSVGLVETMAKFSIYGADAGTKLTQVIMRLQKAGIGYKSGQFNLNDALNQTNAIMAKAHTAKQKDAVISKIFGIRQQTTARILLSSTDTINKFTEGVTHTEEAERAAHIQTSNLHTAIERLGVGWENMLTGSDQAKEGITNAADAIRWLTANLSDVVGIGFSIIKFYLEWKAVMLAATIITKANSIAMGIQAGIFGLTNYAIFENTIATKAMAISNAIATGSITAFNAALGMTPFGWAVIGIAALVAGDVLLSKREAELIELYKEKIKLDTTKEINKETDSIKKLVEQYHALGQSIKEATVNAIKYRMATADYKEKQAETRAAETERKLKEEKGTPGIGDIIAMSLSGQTFTSNKERELAAQLKEQQTTGKNAAADKVAALQFAQAQISNGTITKSDLGLHRQAPIAAPSFDIGSAWGNQFAQRESTTQSKFHYEGTKPVEGKQEITIIMKNDSDSIAQVMAGKTKLADVMPKTTSTKTLTPR